jgi:pimeloyl-ACP methyl ester carboxylesterase
MPTQHVDGLGLHHDVHGCWRDQPIALLHGFTSSHGGNWGRRGWMDLLAERGFRVVGLDFPGHGKSERSNFRQADRYLWRQQMRVRIGVRLASATRSSLRFAALGN